MAAPTATSRPGRTLVALLLLIVAMAVGVFFSGERTPRLALDLEGGTQVTLRATPVEGGQSVTSNAMNTAVEIIRERVNAFGVSEAEVAKQGGDNIIVSIPGDNQQGTAEKVGQTALLYFRPVLAIGGPLPKNAATAPTGSPSASPSGTASGTPSATPSASPSATRTQGRVLPEALRASTPKPTATGSAKPSATPPAPPPQPADQIQGTVPPELQQAWDTLDCTSEEVRNRGDLSAKDKPTVSCERNGSVKYALGPAEVEGTMLKGAEAQLDSTAGGGTTGQWIVSLSFDGKGTKAFADSTRKLFGKQAPENAFAIVLDGKVVSAPAINDGPITGGSAQIEGSFTQREATDLANVLKFGALPLRFEQQDVSQVSATLGSDQLDAGIMAGIIGLVLVALFCLLYYRGLGFVALASLVVLAVMTYLTVVLLGPLMGFALSLPAIAGLIVAVGIAADSFVVYFERLRDEVREGRSLRSAVEAGWLRARRTIISADMVSLFAAIALYLLSVGSVKGFAFTLGLTTVIDLVVVFLFTKPLVAYLARTRFFGDGHTLSGLNPDRLGAQKTATTTARRRPAAAKEA